MISEGHELRNNQLMTDKQVMIANENYMNDYKNSVGNNVVYG